MCGGDSPHPHQQAEQVALPLDVKRQVACVDLDYLLKCNVPVARLARSRMLLVICVSASARPSRRQCRVYTLHVSTVYWLCIRLACGHDTKSVR